MAEMSTPNRPTITRHRAFDDANASANGSECFRPFTYGSVSTNAKSATPARTTYSRAGNRQLAIGGSIWASGSAFPQ